MPEFRIRISRLSVLPMLLLAACATARTPQPAAGPTPTPAVTAPASGDAWALAALTPPEASVRSAANVELKGNELGTMWTFENAPLDYWQKTYNFRPTQEWLDHVRAAALRLPGCTASFVSADGLIMTNHHCARGCVAANSTPERDYVETGFYAATKEEEKLCANSYVDQLLSMQDVTQRVRGAATAGMTNAQVAEATQGMINTITQECQQQSGNRCQVVTLYRGGMYQLYQYKRYSPLKLVMAPELQSGFFGGDYDNFVYPRYALDFAFMRAYEADGRTPVKVKDFFPFDPTGPDENELIFIPGNPGSTARNITVAQVMYERAYRHPMQIQLYQTQRKLIQDLMKTASPADQIRLRENLFGIENSLKKYVGEMAGLRDTSLIATKIKWEQEFRNKAKATPAAQEYLDVWDRIYQLQLQKLQLAPVIAVTGGQWFNNTNLLPALNVVAFVRSAEIPDAQRPPALREAQRAQTATQIASMQVDPARSRPLLIGGIAMAKNWLPPGHPLLGVLLRAGETPEQAAARLLTDAKSADPAARQALLQGGLPALRASTDPLIQLALVIDSVGRTVQPQWQQLTAEETVQQQRLARALFAVYGTQFPADATFTLRISDGVAQGYSYNGTIAPYKTTFHGMYGRSAEFNDAEPFNLPEKFAARKGAVNMEQPIDFVSTNDITGGNSGSPVIDKQGRIIGLAFDGNMEQLPNEYVFRTEAGRTISVFSGGILEALRSIYQAQALVNELTGGK